MNEAEFDRLIKGYLKNSLSASEKELVDRWLASMSDRNTPVDWPDDERARLRSKLMQRISSRKAGQINIVGYERTVWRSVRLRAAAAILLFTVVASYFVWQWNSDSSPTVAEEAGRHEITRELHLPDGSIAWLKGENSVLDTSGMFSSGGERIVYLEGEALLEVAKDPQHPFVIRCSNGASTRVLGTSFNIKAYDGEVDVTVLTGKVALASADNLLREELRPMERAVYSVSDNHIERTTINEQARIGLIEGTAYNMRFADAKMREIIPRIEDKFDVKVQLSDEDLRNCRITADFTDHSLEETLDLIGQLLDTRWITKNNTVILKGAGCK